LAESCEEARQELYRILLAGRVRLTKPRRALLELFLAGSPGQAFCADDLTAELNRREPGIVSRATVYRCLELLEQAGLLERSESAPRQSWSLRPTAGSSIALVDSTGQRLEEIPGLLPALERFIARIAPPGFRAERAVLRIYGKFEEEAPAKQKKRSAGTFAGSSGRRS
jgi:Fe2+ or Zn2+ uptake regulation protein